MSAMPVLRGAKRRPSFADVSVNIKVIAAVAVGAVVALVVGIDGLSALGSSSNSAQLIYISNVASIKDVGLIKYGITQPRVNAANQALSTTASATSAFENDFGQDVTAVNAAIAAYRGSQPAASTALIDTLQSQWTAYQNIATTELLPLGRKNAFDAWSKVRDTQVTPLIAQLTDTITHLDQLETADAAKNAAAAKRGYESSRRTAIIALIVGLAVALGLGVIPTRTQSFYR